MIVWTSFLLATMSSTVRYWIALNSKADTQDFGGYRVVVVASYWFDLYDPGQFEDAENYISLFSCGTVALLLAVWILYPA